VEKKYKQGEIGCHENTGSNKNPLKTTHKQRKQPKRVMTQAYTYAKTISIPLRQHLHHRNLLKSSHHSSCIAATPKQNTTQDPHRKVKAGLPLQNSTSIAVAAPTLSHQKICPANVDNIPTERSQQKLLPVDKSPSCHKKTTQQQLTASPKATGLSYKVLAVTL
jgi:hypothetical protein